MESLLIPIYIAIVKTIEAHSYAYCYISTGLVRYNLHEDVSLDPVVQSVVSLTSSLRVISLTVLADSIYNILIFFAKKMWVALALQKLLTFFQQKCE